MSENIFAGHRQRLKEEVLRSKVYEEIPDVKLLEMLLFYGIPQKDTASISKELLENFGSLGGVIEADIDDLLKIKGMTRNAAGLIKLMRPIGRSYVMSKLGTKETLKSYDDIGNFIHAKYFNLDKECFSVLCLNRLGEVLDFSVVVEGNIDSVGVSVRAVVERVIKSNATAVAVAHNHPSGIALPSPQDVDITKAIATALKGISVNLVDHLIISGNEYISMAQTAEYAGIFKV